MVTGRVHILLTSNVKYVENNHNYECNITILILRGREEFIKILFKIIDFLLSKTADLFVYLIS